MKTLSTPPKSWDVRNDGMAVSPEEGVAADFALLDAAAEGLVPPTLRLWRNRRCLVVSGRDARLPGFSEARDQLAGEGWPVVVRGSGGTAVPHGPGVLLVGMVYTVPARTGVSIEEGYRRLCTLMVNALAALDVPAQDGQVPAAFCDGRYNLTVGQQKIAGTAQRWRRRVVNGVARQAVLAHALLLVEGDVEEMTGAVNRFYELAGGESRFDPEAVTTIARYLGRSSGAMDAVCRSLMAAAKK